MAESIIHEPLQLLQLDSDGRKIKLNQENLDAVLGRSESRPLSIISVAGAARQGKSFLFGHIIRCLEALENDEPDWMDWDNPGKPLSGFLWDEGKSPEVSGTWICNRPFKVKANDKDLAVILLYTQASQQDFLKDAGVAALVGLSLQVSSCIIFNAFKQIPENFLTAVGSFIKYGLLGNGEEGSGKPFQKNIFLVRDWSFPADMPYGGKGGKKLLEVKMEKKRNHSNESKSVRQLLETGFQSVECYLMPFPGQAALKSDYSGSIAELDQQFAKNLEDFVSNLINTEDFPASQVGGTEVTGENFKQIMEAYLESVNSGEEPSSSSSFLEREDSFLDRSTDSLSPSRSLKANGRGSSGGDGSPNKSSSNKRLETATKKYTDAWKKHAKDDDSYLPEKVLTKTHKLALKQALELFRKTAAKKEDSEDEVPDKQEKKAQKKLKEQLVKKFKEVQEENEEKREKFLRDVINKSIKEYKDKMSASFSEGDSFDEKKFLRLSRQRIDQILEKVNEDDEDGDLDTLTEDLQEKLKNEEKKLLAITKERLKQSDEYVKTLVDEIITDYKTKMAQITGENLFLPTAALKTNHEKLVQQFLDQFKEQVNDPGKINFLKSELDDVFESIQQKCELKQKDAEFKTKRLITSLEEKYTGLLQRKVASPNSATADLKTFHSQEKANILGDFKQHAPYPQGTPQYSQYLQTLKENLETIFTEILDEKAKANSLVKKKLDNDIKKAMKDAQTFYIDRMTKLLSSRVFLEAEMNQLTKASDGIIDAAVENCFTPLKRAGGESSDSLSKENLKSKLEDDYKKFVTFNGDKLKTALVKMKVLVSDCEKEYQKTLNSNVKKVRRSEELEEMHQKAMKSAIQNFKDKCPLKDDIQFMKPYIDHLKENMQDIYLEVQDVHQLTIGNQLQSIKQALASCRRFYNAEMETHFKNHEFIRPDKLEKLHKEVSQNAIKKCKENVAGVTSTQVEELENALKQTFEKYQEENDMNLDTEPAIGIDLGTTYSCVAVYMKGKTRIIPNAIGKYTTPSYVAFDDNGAETIGEPAKNQAYQNPEHTIFDAKRIIGRKFDDEKLQSDMRLWPFTVIDDFGIPKISILGKNRHPEEISAKILQELKENAEKHLNCKIKNAVITVPAYFTDGQRQATVDAGELAGLKVLYILTEPVAAAIAYKLQHSDEGERKVLIFDLGGGTFDVAVLKSSEGKVEVLAVDGDTHLGGEDFDKNLMTYCAEEFKKQHNVDLFQGKDSSDKRTKDDVRRRLKRLQGECERKKIELTSGRRTTIGVDRMHGMLDLKVTLTRDKFDELNDQLFKKTIQVVETVLRDSKVEKGKIDDIVMVGGSTRIPKIQKMLTDFFGGKALNSKINPDEAVAYGAAVQAAIMNGAIAKDSIDFTKIQDVTPMSIGVEVYGGGFSVIIPKSTGIPVKLQERYKTAHNNQTSVQITIFQGEDPIAVRNQHLGDFYLNGIPPKAAEVENIEVEMTINEQGILHVKASCGGGEAIKVIQSKQRMGRAAINKYLEDAGTRTGAAA